MEINKPIAAAILASVRRTVKPHEKSDGEQGDYEDVGYNSRSYKMHGGKFLDAFNERLAEDFENARFLPQLHPTKGFRHLSYRRLSAGEKVEPSLHGWAALAAKITGSAVGGMPRERNRRPRLPHQGARECARRARQIAEAI